MTETTRHVFVALSLAALLVAAPMSLNSGKLMSYDAAFAAAGGNGKGNGNGAANGASSGANSGASANNGSSQGNKNGIDNGNSDLNVANNEPDSNNGKNDLGRLNAFMNASPNALKHSSPKSAIGIIAVQYRDALSSYLDGVQQGVQPAPTIDDAAAILAKAANKPVTADIVAAINAKLAAENPDNLSLAGLVDPVNQTTSTQLATDLSTEANTLQQTEANQGLGPIY